MVRVRRSVSSRKSRKKILKQAKGYTGARSKRLRTAKEQVMHAGNDAFAHRKDKKATYRKIWISRINAASREHGLPYSCLLYTSPSPRDLSTSRMPSSA